MEFSKGKFCKSVCDVFAAIEPLILVFHEGSLRST